MFDGFTAEDFDAYLPEKWGSNMFTLPRRRVKDKLEVLGRRLSSELTEFGFGLVMHLSDDHPSLWNSKKVDSQWLFFSRDEAAQKRLSEVIDTERTLAATLMDPTPLYRHVFLGVSLDKDILEVGIRLHHDAWVDRKNMTAILGDEETLGRLVEMLRGLPEEFSMGLVGGDLVAASDLDGAKVREIAARFEDEKGWVVLGSRIPADKAAGMEAGVADLVSQHAALLAPIFQLIAWSPTNDAVSMDNLVAKRRETVEAAQAELESERSEREARRREEEERRQALRHEVEEKARADQAWRRRERLFRRTVATRLAAEEEEKKAAAPASEPTPTPEASVDDNIGNLKPEGVDEPTETRLDPPAPRREAKDRDERPRSSERGGERRGGPRRDDKRGPRRDNRDRPALRAKAAKEPRLKQAPPAPTKVSKERMENVAVGDGVIVQKGFLKGRFGIVQSVDEKGDLKVAFGALTSRVPRADVEGRGPSPERLDQQRGKRR